MKPRIFVSSTYYDLRYIREDIDQFVRGYRFETILFENGDIGYEPGKPLDEACYRYISKADMVILVVFLLSSNSFCCPCVRHYPAHWKYKKKKRERESVLDLQGTSYP